MTMPRRDIRSALKAQITLAALLLGLLPAHAHARMQAIPGHYYYWGAHALERPMYPRFRQLMPGWRNAKQSSPHTSPEPAAADTSKNGNANTPTSVRVLIAGMRFLPAVVRIKTGDEVTWINQTHIPHAVTSPSNGSLASDRLMPGSRYTHTFDRPGIYIYYSALHTAMFGQVIVE